jgi:mRNA-degrading endonuclease toxin of MazEF toxin-antitoxin module
MPGHSIKFKRGTIWLYREDEYQETNLRRGFASHVQGKTRPVLIVSSDYGNMHSPVVNVVPLTTADKPCSVNVPIEHEDGTLNYILCNQIKTVDSKQLSYYMSTIDDETMTEVEKTINYALGISVPRVEKSIKDIETMIQNVVTMKFNDLSTRDEFDAIVEKIAKGLESTYGDLMKAYVSNLNTAEKRIKAAAPELNKLTEFCLNYLVVSFDFSSIRVKRPNTAFWLYTKECIQCTAKYFNETVIILGLVTSFNK